MDNQDTIWKGKETISINTQTGKVDFNRRNLKKFFNSHKTYEITKEIFLDYFNKDSLCKVDEETGCYLSHLLFLDGAYFYSQVYPFVFDFVSPQELNRDGQLYIDCVFQSHMRLDFNDYKKLILDASNYFNLVYHTDYQGNNILHWVVTGEAIDEVKKILPLFTRWMYYESNNYGVSLNTLKQLSLEMKRFTLPCQFQEFGDCINAYHQYEQGYKNEFFPNFVYAKEDKVMQRFMRSGQWKRVADCLPINY